MDEVELEHLIPLLMTICQAASEAILAIYTSGDNSFQEKTDASPVTLADVAAHQVIMKGLQGLQPCLPVLSEEGDVISQRAASRQWPHYWLVDPLDGTREFIERTGEFTVNIALVSHHQPVLGVIYVPLSGVCYWGIKGKGAFKVVGDSPATPIHVRPLAPRLADGLPLDVVGSRRVGLAAQDELFQRLQTQLGAIALTPIGSSLKFCLLAEGLSDFYPRLGPTSEWDTAAAQAILEAAGGLVVDTRLQPLRYNLHESLLNPHFYALADPSVDWAALLLNT